MRILYVEDSTLMRESVASALRRSGYAVEVAADGAEALSKLEHDSFDVALLDIMLPKLDGISLLKKIREREKYTPTLLLTAKGEIADRVHGLESGADDYLVKPFSLEELIARVAALSRRGFANSSTLLKVADLEFNTTSMKVHRAGREVTLSAHELAVLELLMRKAGAVLSRTTIDHHFYENDALPMSNVTDVVICSIRKKISFNREYPELIHTRRGLGYILERRS